MDLDTGAVVAVEVHEADKGDTSTLHKTLKAAQESLGRVTPTPPCPDNPAELIADKGYFSRDVLKDLDGGPWRTRIAEPKHNGLNSWRGDHEARRAVYNNRARISSGVGKSLGRLRTEFVERSFEHTLDRSGGMRRVWLRGRENIQQTLPAPRGRVQPRPPDAAQDRPRHPKGLGRRLACGCLARNSRLSSPLGHRLGCRKSMLPNHARRCHAKRTVAQDGLSQQAVKGRREKAERPKPGGKAVKTIFISLGQDRAKPSAKP